VKHKVDWGPGYRWFHCESCEHMWDEKSRDCQSPSISTCPKCNEITSPYGWEKHYEWPTDQSGNLI
jgi:hypothetical protein